MTSASAILQRPKPGVKLPYLRECAKTLIWDAPASDVFWLSDSAIPSPKDQQER